jgi:hypothetical protein
METNAMGQIVRYEFLGSFPLFFVLCITGIGVPLAVVYLLQNTVGVVETLDDPARFVREYRAGGLKRR